MFTNYVKSVKLCIYHMERPPIEKGQMPAQEHRPEEGQEALPELQLTELLKSEKPINEVEDKKLVL